MKEQIIQLEGLVGKTISRIKITDSGELYIVLDDGRFAVFEARDIAEGYGYSRHVVDIDTYCKDATCRSLLELDIINKNEYDIANKEEEERYNRAKKERQEKEELRQEAIELEQYQRLQKKFNK